MRKVFSNVVNQDTDKFPRDRGIAGDGITTFKTFLSEIGLVDVYMAKLPTVDLYSCTSSIYCIILYRSSVG